MNLQEIDQEIKNTIGRNHVVNVLSGFTSALFALAAVPNNDHRVQLKLYLADYMMRLSQAMALSAKNDKSYEKVMGELSNVDKPQ